MMQLATSWQLPWVQHASDGHQQRPAAWAVERLAALSRPLPIALLGLHYFIRIPMPERPQPQVHAQTSVARK